MHIARFLFLALGLGAVVACFVGLSSASLPYPDPTPAMLAAQEQSIRWWQAGLVAGIAVSAVAAAAIWRFARRGRGHG